MAFNARSLHHYWPKNSPEKLRAIVGGGLSTCLIFTLSNFGVANAAGAKSASPTANPKSGGSVTVVLPGVSSTLDPATTQPFGYTDAQDMNALYGELAYENPQTGAIQLGFLESLKGSANFRTWTLALRPGLKFSDGSPFNAAAIEYNWKRIQNPATASLYEAIVKGWNFQVVNNTTLVVTLPSPNSAFPAIVAESLASIGSPKAMKAEGTKFGLNPVGAGPFKLQSFTPASKVTTVRNPFYGLFAKGQPYLDTLVFQALPDTSQQVNAIRTGQAQAGYTLGSGDLKSMSSLSNVKELTSDKPGGYTLIFSEKQPPFNNSVAREAFSLAMNRATIANAMLPGSPPINNFFPPSSPFYSSKYNFPAENPGKAQALFNQLAAQGHPFSVTYLAVPTDRSQTLADTIQSSLASYKNVTMTIKTVPLATYTDMLNTGDFEVTIHNLLPTALEPFIYTSLTPPGGSDFWGFNDPVMTKALSQTLRIDATDTAALKPLYDTFQAELLKEDPAYFAAKTVVAVGYVNTLTNVHVLNDGDTVLWGELGYKA
jgi:peptide/nickel transport system substrate-binding protein